MDVHYAMRCKDCHEQDFAQDYENGPIACRNCGVIDNAEPLPDDEMGDLADMLQSAHVYKEPEVSPEMQQMLNEILAEEQRKKDNMSLGDMMSGMRVSDRKRPSNRR